MQVGAARLTDFDLLGVVGSEIYWDRVARAFEGSGLWVRHINGNVGFPPLFHRLIRDLIGKNTHFPLPAP